MIKQKIETIRPLLESIRHQIHQHPELGFEEVKTADLVAEKLIQWGYQVHRGLGKTGVIGTLKVGNSHKVIGIRADMDALPIQENNGKKWASQIPNRMHGCGHDGHTTMLLGAAKYLAETQNFDGTIHLIFQPAEEGLGGADAMLKEGLFKQFPCDAIFAMHNMPGYPTGHFFFQDGPLMASQDQVHITINGCGGHGAMPSYAIDPVLVASHITVALQSIVSRNVNPLDAAVITVGAIQAGEAANVIPSSALMKLSIRALKPEVRAKLLERIEQLAKSQAESFGATAEVKHVIGSPPLINDKTQTEFAYHVAKNTFADKAHYGMQPLMGSEDFSFMLEENPHGCYLVIGNGEVGQGSCMVHNPGYDFNDDCLVPGAAFWCALTETFLQ
ncbi:M20 aminoacylase family protein [Utexia brackfieldae]|uniref:M20 aminoacylase family protein n=1 Tax=Utexia brackfieldae TaxID=3074108 RepID=UPI00370DB647